MSLHAKGRSIRVGIAALSGPCQAVDLQRGLDALRELDCEPVPAPNLTRQAGPCGMFAGTDAERLDSFHDLLRDERLDAVVFARGGHGVLRLLQRVDWTLLSKRVRAGLRICGYSDVTPLLLETTRRTGRVTLHGPMVAIDLARGLDDRESELFVRALHGAYASSHVLKLEGALDAPVHGRLLGGCLSLVVATIGTAFSPAFDNAIVFCEDIGEPVYRRDRMLTHLGLSGTLATAKALVYGHFEDSTTQRSPEWTVAMQESRDRLALPTASGLMAGHGIPNYVLPVGAPSTLTPQGLLEIRQPVTLGS